MPPFIVDSPGDYLWSSYAKNAFGNAEPLIESHPLYLSLGAEVAQCQLAYRELFRHYLDDVLVHEIREALQQELALGRDDFKDKIEQMLNRQTRPGKLGRPRIEERRGIYYVI